MTVFRAGLRLWPLLAALATGCDMPGKPNRADRPIPSDQVTDFGTLYRTHCAGCHGADGRLGPGPPLNDPLFLAIVSEKELSRVITEGRAVTPGQKSPMPAFARANGGPLTDAQIEALAAGIKQRWGPPAPGPLPADLSLTGGKGGDDKRGAVVFARACAGCHGNTGEGVEREGRIHRKINDPAFLALISDQALHRYIITGRPPPDLGMPPYDGKTGRAADFQPLTSAEIDDLVALLALWRQGESAQDKGGSER
jgi:cytochrome c oxidase cbb3-type subunit 3/ubiquinol-cytochrome c reductase cytochrome c subunit